MPAVHPEKKRFLVIRADGMGMSGVLNGTVGRCLPRQGVVAHARCGGRDIPAVSAGHGDDGMKQRGGRDIPGLYPMDAEGT
ncbi:MAG: hypothetical protein FIA94_07270 [Nitrospirae bacterium]|nr:hypothetical protein [Nitrospirota bacterium]